MPRSGLTRNREAVSFLPHPGLRPRALLRADLEESLSTHRLWVERTREKGQGRPQAQRLRGGPGSSLMVWVCGQRQHFWVEREPWGLAQLPTRGRVWLAGSCLRPSQLLLQKQVAALTRKRKSAVSAEGGALGSGAGFFSWGAVSTRWLGDHGGLECGWTAGGETGRAGQRQGAGTLAKGPEAQGHQQLSMNGAEVAPRAWPPPDISALVPKASDLQEPRGRRPRCQNKTDWGRGMHRGPHGRVCL